MTPPSPPGASGWRPRATCRTCASPPATPRATAAGPVFADSDVYKWLEAAAWEYGRRPAERLLREQREVTALVAQAQADDGYLDSVVQVRYGRDGRYQDLPWSHEHYCAGPPDPGGRRAGPVHRRPRPARRRGQGRRPPRRHLRRGPASRRRRPPSGRDGTGGALPRDRRPALPRPGQVLRRRPRARPDGVATARSPRTSPTASRCARQTTVEGHAVRAVYLAAGAADVAAELGDKELLASLEAAVRPHDRTKTYLTGGLGAALGGRVVRRPVRAAARPRLRGDVRGDRRRPVGLADAARHRRPRVRRRRRSACSSTASWPGCSLSGDEYFYVNPLQLRGGAHPRRQPQPRARPPRRGSTAPAARPTSCARSRASPAISRPATSDGVQVHQYATGEQSADVGAATCAWPCRPTTRGTAWCGCGSTRAGTEAWTLSLRVPAWADGADVGRPG